MKKIILLVLALGLLGGAYALVFRPAWDLQKGDKIKAVIINENTGEVLEGSNEITLR